MSAVPPSPSPAPAAARASTRPQSEPRWSLLLLLTLLGLTAALATLLGGRWALAAAAGGGLAGLAVMAWREQALLRRLASGAEAMAALDQPLLILDADDRVRWASAAYARLYPGLGRVAVGTPYAELKRRVLASEALDLAGESPEDWLARRLRDHASSDGHVRLQPMRDGRVLQVIERRTALGGWTSTAFDVTDLVSTRDALMRARDEAQAAKALLDDALEAMPAGFEIWDREDRLLRCNRRLLDLYPGSAEALKPGVSFVQVLRESLARGEVPTARGREAEWLAERMAQRGRLGRPFLVDYGERWIQIDERRTREGLLVCVRTDLTELVEARQQLTQARARAEAEQLLLRRCLDALPIGVEIFDADDRLVLANALFRSWQPRLDYERLIGLRFEELLRISQREGLLPKEAQDDPEAWIAARLQRRQSPRASMLMRTHDGRVVLTQELLTPEGYLVTTRQDLSPLREKEEALELANAQLQALIQGAAAAIVTIDARGHLRSMNTSAQALWGDDEGDLIGKPSRYLLHPDAQPEAVAAFLTHRDGGDGGLVGRRREFIGQHRDGRALILQAAISEVKAGIEPFYVAVITDMTELRRTEAQLREANERLRHLSNTDGLTGLANRRALMNQLQLLWGQGLREQTQLAVVLIDVDHFKRYNDHHGHQAGDEVLRAVGELLKAQARRAGDLAARYGGEEFVLLLAQCELPAALTRAEAFRERLAALALPHGDAPLARVSASLGVAAVMPSREGSAEELLRRADEALYAAKAAGRDCVRAAV